MIIDLILDRRAGDDYSARDFYFDVMGYGPIGYEITRAMDGGTENDIRRALCSYIRENGYNPEICKYVNSVSWL